jgi:hypothetical protein
VDAAVENGNLIADKASRRRKIPMRVDVSSFRQVSSPFSGGGRESNVPTEDRSAPG